MELISLHGSRLPAKKHRIAFTLRTRGEMVLAGRRTEADDAEPVVMVHRDERVVWSHADSVPP